MRSKISTAAREINSKMPLMAALDVKKLMENRLLTIKAAENVIRILPPLNVKKNEIDIALKVINKVCSES